MKLPDLDTRVAILFVILFVLYLIMLIEYADKHP